MESNKKILITGGHLTPALAVVSELKKRNISNILWVGHKYAQMGTTTPSAEYNQVTSLNIPFISLKTGKLIRDWSFSTFFYGIKNLFSIFLGFLQSFTIILKEKPDLVVSFGGYLALPVVISAKILGRKVITHEQTLVVGLANKIISKLADKVLVSWNESLKYFPKNKTNFTGNPIREDIFKVQQSTLLDELDTTLPILLVYGGNQGAHEINKRIFNILNDLVKDFNIIPQTGNSSVTKDNLQAVHVKASLPLELRNRYKPIEYINGTDVGAVLNKADILVSRSGANTISEILALGKLSILIPIPKTSHNEQTLNAQFVEKNGLAIHLAQDKLSEQKLYQTILLLRNQLKDNRSANNLDLNTVRESAKSLINMNAASNVVDVIEKYL